MNAHKCITRIISGKKEKVHNNISNIRFDFFMFAYSRSHSEYMRVFNANGKLPYSFINK